MNVKELTNVLSWLPEDTEDRIGDVAEQDDLHCSLGKVVHRNGVVVLVTGSDEIWKDETLASLVLSETLYPTEEEESED